MASHPFSRSEGQNATGESGASLDTARFLPASEIPGALDLLYVALRGAPYVNALNEAKKAFQERDYRETHRLVQETGELHRRAHLHVLQKDPVKAGLDKKETRHLAEKQERIKELLARFEALSRQLEKMAKMQPEKPKAVISDKPRSSEAACLSPCFLESFYAEFQAAVNNDAKIQAVRNHFLIQAVSAEIDLQCGDFYLVQNQGQFLFVQCTKRDGDPALFQLTLIPSQKPLKPLLLDKLLKLGQKRLLHRLTAKKLPGSNDLGPNASAGDNPKDAKGGSQVSIALIEKGAFTQLQRAAAETGLLANADAVGYVRDNEFRNGRYQQAFDRIEGLFIQMRTAAEQRTAKRRQEETNYRNGLLQMTLKEWMAKQQRDAAESQKVLRTLRYATKILDGLRLVMTAKQEYPNVE